jgi:serine/threonine-protein kinase
MSSRQRVAPRALTLDLDFSHDRIAHLVWIGPFAGERGHFDVMIEEQPEGQVLAERPAMSPREAIELCRQIAAALIELHEYGWIVRGIRPELTYVDGAALTQLVPRHELFMQTATPTSHGVPPVFDRIYMAPEILANRPAVPRSDVFSVCAMLWELVAGRHPFGEAVGFPMVERIIAGEREPWTGSAPLGALLERGLATDPARRPDAAELVAELAPLRDPG